MINPAKWSLLGAIRVYQWVLSPLKRSLFGTAGACRFSPSCSHYAWQAIYHHGILKGTWLASLRLLRCHPWGGHGFDPVPPKGVK